MKEHPILFSGPMVRAILEGRKTMTRRVAKLHSDKLGDEYMTETKDGLIETVKLCPHGKAGDRLWVRETFFNSRGDDSMPTHYRADENLDYFQLKWKPSIFMPRWASRITLEVDSVKIERLQSIGEADAMSEGCPTEDYQNFRMLWDSINAKRGYGWDVNPWVWVIQFHRL